MHHVCMNTIETRRISGKQIGVNRDGKPVGYAIRTNRKGQPEHWTAFVNIDQPPFDKAVTGFANESQAVEYLAQHGVPRS
jgi:ribosomal protein L16/L10AE